MAFDSRKYRASLSTTKLADLLQNLIAVQIRNVCIALCLLIEVSACGPKYRREMLGSGIATVRTEGAVPPVSIPIDTAGEQYEVHYAIAWPRAVQLAFAVKCPGDRRDGIVGQKWKTYREARIAELRREREQQRRAVASMGQSIGGAVLGRVAGGAQVSGAVPPPPPQQNPPPPPSGGPPGAVVTEPAPGPQPADQVNGQVNGQVEASVDGGQVGQRVGRAVADSLIDDNVQLPPGDVGADRVHGRFRFVASEPGACQMAVKSTDSVQDIRGVQADFTVTRLVDLAEEERARAEARAAHAEKVDDAALEVRVALGAQMVERGADPELRTRLEAEREAELAKQRQERAVAAALRDVKRAEQRARRDAERAERQARLDAERREREAARAAERRERELRLREQRLEARRLRIAAEKERNRRLQVALRTRRALLGWCVQHGADPELQDRLEAEVEAGRLAAEAERVRLRRKRVAEAEARRRSAEIEEARVRRRRAAAAEAKRRRRVAVHNGSLTLRASLMGYLQSQGADPGYQLRLEEARERAQADRARARRAAHEARLQRRQLALETRGDLRAFLRAQGALTVEERQPPPPPAETRPPEPFAGAIWVPGRYVSVHGTWQWRSGHWKRPPRSWTIPTLPAGISIEVGGASVGVEAVPPPPRTRDRRRAKPRPRRSEPVRERREPRRDRRRNQ